MHLIDGKSILITGGTGSFGREMVRVLLKTAVGRIAIFSRDELKQHDMKNQLPKDERLRFFLGDIRDESRLKTALHGVDLVVHAAALKQVDTGEYNPMEFIQTNVFGESKPHKCGDSLRGRESSCPLYRQSFFANKLIWGDKIDRRQVVCGSKQYLEKLWNFIFGCTLR